MTILELIKNYNNIIYLCSHEEWNDFINSVPSNKKVESFNNKVAIAKWLDTSLSRQVSHTWYHKCHYNKLNKERPLILLVGKGFEFDVSIINRLEAALHPIKGRVIYAR